VVFRVVMVRIIVLVVDLMRRWSVVLVVTTIIVVLSVVLKPVRRRSMMFGRPMMLERRTSARRFATTFAWRPRTRKVTLSGRATTRWLIMVMTRRLLVMWRRWMMVWSVRTRLIARWSVTAFVTMVFARAVLASRTLRSMTGVIVLLSSIFGIRLRVT